ncbi:hypothetical protein H9P43_000733 [Blastocladiella emersonii ATCC 22665]|nr:hypothetical protein H9P43_000733 [Blastocladiella emersonii ATCC 22665]
MADTSGFALGSTLLSEGGISGSFLGLSMGSLGSRMDLGYLFPGRQASSNRAPPEMEQLKTMHRQLNEEIEKLDTEQSEHIRKVFYWWRRDHMATEGKIRDAVAKALHDAQFHDKCKATESKLRNDLALLVHEMSDLTSSNGHLQEQIRLLRRERDIEESLNRTAVEEMARRKRQHDKMMAESKAASSEPNGPDVSELMGGDLESVVRTWISHNRGAQPEDVDDEAVAEALMDALAAIEARTAAKPAWTPPEPAPPPSLPPRAGFAAVPAKESDRLVPMFPGPQRSAGPARSMATSGPAAPGLLGVTRCRAHYALVAETGIGALVVVWRPKAGESRLAAAGPSRVLATALKVVQRLCAPL